MTTPAPVSQLGADPLTNALLLGMDPPTNPVPVLQSGANSPTNVLRLGVDLSINPIPVFQSEVELQSANWEPPPEQSPEGNRLCLYNKVQQVVP